MVGQQIYSPASFGAVVVSSIRDSRSGMDKNQDPGSATLHLRARILTAALHMDM